MRAARAFLPLCARSCCDKSVAEFRTGVLVTDLKSEIKKILDEHESSFRLSPPSSFITDDFEKSRKERERDFYLMKVHLTEVYDSIDDDAVEELKQNIENKLAYDSLPRIGGNWWWSPASDLVARTLRDVKRTLDKTSKKKTQHWHHKLRWPWRIFVELVYVAVVLGLFSVATSKFETIVVAALVLIYNRVAGVGLGTVWSFAYLAYATEMVHWQFGRALRLQVPIAPLTDAKKSVEGWLPQNILHLIAIGIGSLIALWHLAVVLLG
jgi:hypothetical protein